MRGFFKKNSPINPILLKNNPLTFREAVSHWPALSKWTDAYLMEAFQDSKARNLFTFDSNFERNRQFCHTAKSGFTQVLQGNASQRFYLTRQPLINKEESLLKDIQIPDWIMNKRFYMPNIWADKTCP